MNDYTTSFAVDQTPNEVFEAINNVREWWGPNVEGDNTAVGDEFTYRVPDIHTCTLRVVELIPDQKVVWVVLDNHMSFVEDQSEWIGTTITFEIDRRGDQTEVRFAHLGLFPKHECYDVCSNAWGSPDAPQPAQPDHHRRRPRIQVAVIPSRIEAKPGRHRPGSARLGEHPAPTIPIGASTPAYRGSPYSATFHLPRPWVETPVAVSIGGRRLEARQW
jgi:activator of Hsp90 ATPase-like protein